jgi:alpha-amylase
MISKSPYWFSRIYKTDKVGIGLDLPKGTKEVNVTGIFDNGTRIKDAYSGATMPVIEGKISLTNDNNIVLLEKD